MPYPCWLTDAGCPCGITQSANPNNWPFDKCRGEGKGWNARSDMRDAARSKLCPAYAYYKGQSDEILPWMAQLRASEGLTEDEIRNWARYYGAGP